MKLMLSITLLAATISTQAQQRNTHFSHTLETSASPEKIWRIWTDVPNWQQWDSGLRSAELRGSFLEGTKGILTPSKGPVSTFVIGAVIPNESYTFRTKLPLGALYVRRHLIVKEGRTQFTHEVWFTGLTKGLFGQSLGKNYRAMLPGVMAKISALAENQ